MKRKKSTKSTQKRGKPKRKPIPLEDEEWDEGVVVVECVCEEDECTCGAAISIESDIDELVSDSHSSTQQVSEYIVPLCWLGFNERQRYSAMFHSASHDVEVDVWGAPCRLHLHRSILQQAHCSLFDLYLYNTEKTPLVIPITKETLQDLYGQEPAGWKMVWSYLGLLYGIGVLDATHTDSSPLWIETRHGLPPSRIIQVIRLCDYLNDNGTLRLLGKSLDCFVATLDHEITPDPQTIDKTLLQVLYSQFHHLGLSSDGPLFHLLYQEVKAIANREVLSPPVAHFLQRALASGTFLKTSKIRKSLAVLSSYEHHWYSRKCFEECGEYEKDALQACAVPVTIGLWKKLRGIEVGSDYTCVFDRHYDPYCIPLMQPKLGTGLQWLRLYWTHVFPSLTLELQQRLFVSGSLIPMCLLTFYNINFRATVNTLFAESDMDVYVHGEEAEPVAQQVQSYLEKEHEHVYEEQRSTFRGTTVITLVLPSHPLQHNTSLRVQLIYYSTSVTPQQVVTYHHLCPVRAYYLPSSHEVVAMPSALLCWATGYMSSYRLRGGGDSVELLTVFKYLARKFGVHYPTGDKNEATTRLIGVARKVNDMFTETSYNNILLLSLYPKLHLQTEGDSLQLTAEGRQLLQHFIEKRITVNY